jgi:hypothetical protein
MSGNPNLQPVRKRKKHAPDRKQPEWLFPADSENPALKPHKEPTLKEKLEIQRSIEFLTHRAVGAPMKPAPPVQLLNLIGAFLAEYGFTSTGRLFSTERQGRSKLDGWKDDTGGKLEKGMPTLGKIYKEWRKEWEERRLLEMTSSDEEDDAATKREKMLARKERLEKQKNKAKDDATSSSGSGHSGSSSSGSSSEDSDAEMQDASTAKRSAIKKAKSSSGSSTSSTTSSDSDADDEKEVPAAKYTIQKPKLNNLKRKASPSVSSSSASESGPPSEDDAPKSKKAKTSTDSSSSNSDSDSDSDSGLNNGASSDSSSGSRSSSDSNSESSNNSMAKKTPLSASSESDSSSDSDSDSSSDDDNKNKPLISSDTSATLSDGPKKYSPIHSENSSNESAAESNAKTVKLKGKNGLKSPTTPATQLPRKANVPFSRIPKDIKVDERLASNAYVPYDYAQKAHEDLIITKGKNFTKEKNKKKRGSYKGGYIDVEGKKGIKFEG